MYTHVLFVSFMIQFQTLIFPDFCEQGDRSRCSQDLENLVYLKYSRKTLYYFFLPVSEHLIYLYSNPLFMSYLDFYTSLRFT